MLLGVESDLETFGELARAALDAKRISYRVLDFCELPDEVDEFYRALAVEERLLDEPLAEFDASTYLFFYDCDPGSSNTSQCTVDSQDPGAGAAENSRPAYCNSSGWASTERIWCWLAYQAARSWMSRSVRLAAKPAMMAFWRLPSRKARSASSDSKTRGCSRPVLQTTVAFSDSLGSARSVGIELSVNSPAPVAVSTSAWR